MTVTVAFVIPFRDRHVDRFRATNKEAALRWVHSMRRGDVAVVDDGRTGNDQFNRSAAYNRGAHMFPDADVIVFYESDLLVPHVQLAEGIRLAAEAPGLVVPFSRFFAMPERMSEWAKAGTLLGRIPVDQGDAEQVRGERKSIGAVNICSRETLAAIGRWDESFEGAWYDDDSMEIAFRTCCGPTRFVDGPGFHMFHLPGASGGHLTASDRAATARNRARWELYRAAEGNPDRIRELTAGGQ